MTWNPVAVCGGVCLSLSLIIWSVSRPNYRELRLEDGAVVLGSNQSLWWRERQFFFVRLESAQSGETIRSPVRLALRGRELVLREVTVTDLIALGAELSPNHPRDAAHAFVGFGEQNRSGGLEFDFAGPTLRRFYARCFDAGECDFELRWPGRHRIRLPVPEGDVPAAFPGVTSVRDYHGH